MSDTHTKKTLAFITDFFPLGLIYTEYIQIQEMREIKMILSFVFDTNTTELFAEDVSFYTDILTSS